VIVPPGSVDVSLLVLFVDDDELPVTGLTYLTMPTVYWFRAGVAETVIPLSALASADAAHSDGGVFELGIGRYRLDIPDAAVSASGAIDIGAEATDKRLLLLQAQAGGVSLLSTQRVKLDTTQPDYAPAKAGDAMALTSGERAALSAVVESHFSDEGGSGIHNPIPLMTAISAARTTRVPVMVYSDSNTYTFGGWQQGLSLALRGIQPLYASPVLGNGQTGFNQGIEPRRSTAGNGDGWSIQSGTILKYNTTTAPAAQLAVFGGLDARILQHVADGVSPGEGYPLTGFDRWSGLNVQEAIRYHFWDVTFDVGSGKWSFQARNNTNYALILATQIVNTNTGSVARRHTTFDLAASGSRDRTLQYEGRTNQGGDVGPAAVYGACVEMTDRAIGFSVQSALLNGGNSSANNLDAFRTTSTTNGRNSHVELWRTVREVKGAGGYCLCVINYGLNDRNDGRASYRYSGVATGGSSTTIVLDDTSGVDHTGSLITKLVLATGARETKTISGYVIGTKTATTTAWTTAAGAGDTYSIGPATDTGDGFKYNIQHLINCIRTDCAAVGLTPMILLIPAWRESAAVNVKQDAFDAASIQLAADNIDVTAVDTDTLFPYSWITTQPYMDGTHPGGYVLASMFTAIVTEAERLVGDQTALVSAIRTDLERNGGDLDTLTTRIGGNITISGGKVGATIATGDMTDLQPTRAAKIDTIATDTGTTIPATLAGIQGTGFDTNGDSLKTIRDAIDSGGTGLTTGQSTKLNEIHTAISGGA